MVKAKEKLKPYLLAQYCKGCGRCIEACAQNCIEFSDEIHPLTGLIPVKIELDACTGCGLCFSACPEPYALLPIAEMPEKEIKDVEDLLGEAPPAPEPVPQPDQVIPLPETEPMILKGTYAAAIGAILAGCRHFFGYPITPSTEGAELMAKVLPKLNGVFMQAVSEVATVNHLYGAGGAGMRSMTFTSSPGFSLMLEGISYMIGAELPAVFINIMRGGPGLGNIAPEQSDIKLACHGLGHGNTHAIVLAPNSPQEMLDFTMMAFDLAFKYRNPVIILGDGYLGQITGKVKLPNYMIKPGIPEWAVPGDAQHRRNLINSIYLSEADLEKHNQHLVEKYQEMEVHEQRADCYFCDDAEYLLIASNTPSRMVKGAVQALRQEGIRAGLFRPLTLWPFPIKHLVPLLERAKHIIVVEASNGQLEDEVRLALSKAGIRDYPPIDHIRHMGGVLPQQHEVEEKIMELEGVLS
ncbi:MAG: 3-methyl-2-oxobutanoate dehydrogenase subunit VorB [Calditrichaeota bacterium]|nr:3-methyl-2-oxobutanoate dehydrogenase subunit VorB [Calditrichota bacterium]